MIVTITGWGVHLKATIWPARGNLWHKGRGGGGGTTSPPVLPGEGWGRNEKMATSTVFR